MIELKEVSRVYDLDATPVHALRGIDLKVMSGEYIAIMGTSGSGKSTLMHILGCLDRPSSGKYSLNGEQVQNYSQDELAAIRNKTIGFVFQQFNLLPRMTALDNVMLPLIYARGSVRASKEEQLPRAQNALRLVGLGDRMNHRPNQLSGGQQQRVSIARALVNNPKILLADEPTGALDSQTSKEIMTLLEELFTQGITVILVTHDNDIASYARRVVRLKDGVIISDSLNNR
ncbi:MAG: ABC transporter ATP-binding protein [Cyanobacteria bacterium SZAS-4]|nr:ABC transporter ATP-binding protein [Cyanobacteria bacterium SZAS-4]